MQQILQRQLTVLQGNLFDIGDAGACLVYVDIDSPVVFAFVFFVFAIKACGSAGQPGYVVGSGREYAAAFFAFKVIVFIKQLLVIRNIL